MSFKTLSQRALACIILASGPAAATGASAQSELDTIDASPVQQSLLSIYGDGIAVVEERRTAVFSGGPATLRITGLPDGMMPDSVALSMGGIAAGDVRLGRDQISQARLLARSVGSRIAWVVRKGDGGEVWYEGTLIAYENGVVMEIDGHIEVMPPGRLVLDSLPRDLVNGTWLNAAVVASQPGDLPISLSYLTPGISWSVDYDVELGADEKSLVLAGQYSLRNDGEIAYPNATVRLVAGSVNRAPGQPIAAPQAKAEMMMSRTMVADAAMAPAPPQQAALGDLHVYDIAAALDLPASATIRRGLFDPVSVPVEKRYLLNGRGDGWPGRTSDRKERQRPVVELSFDNSRKGPLARPLPAGTVRVFGALADDGPDAPRVVLGEARIGHTAVGEPVHISLGQAFDVSAERRMLDFERDDSQWGQGQRPPPYEVEHEITLHNAKDKAVSVEVTEQFSGEWVILGSSEPKWEKTARAATWTVRIPAEGETTLRYRVRISP